MFCCCAPPDGGNVVVHLPVQATTDENLAADWEEEMGKEMVFAPPQDSQQVIEKPEEGKEVLATKNQEVRATGNREAYATLEGYHGDPKLQVVPGTEMKSGAASFVPVLLEVEPSVGQTRVHCDICIVLDISASMNALASIQSSSGEAQCHGLTLLDIAKHGVRTVIASLDGNDRLSLVVFNHDARKAMPLTKMDEAGQKLANTKLDCIQANGATNIWLGLECGLNALREDQMTGRLAHIMLLTDGQTQDRNNVMPNLTAYKQRHEQLPGTLSTFGFGYNIDSDLLMNISGFGDASYSFIPDCGFVGTVFVNTLSNLLVTFATEVFIQLEATDCEIVNVHGNYAMERTDEGARIKLGTLQYEQRRAVVVGVKPKADLFQLGGNIAYRVAQESKESSFHEQELSQKAALVLEQSVQSEWLRCRFIETLDNAMTVLKSEAAYAKARDGLTKFVAEIDASTVTQMSAVSSLRADATGQTTEAVSREDWFKKWGGHYIPSLMFAHKMQQCNNFKDPGVQGYGGILFRMMRDEADDKFNSLPAPKASGARASQVTASQPANMASYNDRYGG